MIAYWFYRLAMLITPLLPERFGYWIFSRIGDIAFYLPGRHRANYLKNLKHVLGPGASQSVLDRITREAFRNLMKNYYDLFRGHRLSADQLREQIEEITGFENLEGALALGKGIVAASIHFGNFNLFVLLAGLYLKEQHEIVVPVKRIEPEAYFQLVKQQRSIQGVEIVPLEQASRPMIKALKAGQIVGMAVDLDVTHSGPKVQFFGSPAHLPDGPVVLALKYQAPLVLTFLRRLPNNHCVAEIHPPLELERTDNMERDVLSGMQKMAGIIERRICESPEQWILFEPVWDD